MPIMMHSCVVTQLLINLVTVLCMNVGGAETQDNAHHDLLRHDHHEDVVGHPKPSARDPPTAEHMQLDAADQLGIDEDDEFLMSGSGKSAVHGVEILLTRTHG